MGSCGCDIRRRPSIILDAGYVSVTSIDPCQSSKPLGLYGTKLICVIFTIVSLVLISSINLTCLIWLMYKLDWSWFDSNGSKIFRFDKINDQVEFNKQVTFQETIYVTQINNLASMNLSIKKQIDMSGDQSSILLDDNQIILNTDRFYFKNNSSIDLTNLELHKFNYGMKTRIHLDRFSSQHIHHKHLNLTATNLLKISNVNRAFFYGQNLILEANRHDRRSILRFSSPPKRKKSYYRQQRISHRSLHVKSDSVFLDLPRLPLLGNNHRGTSGIYRICICNTTFLFFRSYAHLPCPPC